LAPVRFRFASFAATFFVLARPVLLVLRATRVFDAVLLLLTRLRTLDEEAALVVRFALVFTVEAAPAFFVFGLVVFLDLLRATIINLSTRKLSRNARSAHEYYPKSVLEYYSRNGELTFHPGKSLASSPGTLSDFRSMINWSFSTNPSKNQREDELEQL
jgi:ABC-type multidrug transport system fused ATPase/permease subunit